MKTLNYILVFLLFILSNIDMGICQNVVIPDANFRNVLLNSNSINTNGDNVIQISEAAAYSGYLDVSYIQASSLIGIEAFTALTGLDCGTNQLDDLDVSANTNLQTLKCLGNQLTSLDVSANTALTYLDCRDNYLEDLDISSNVGLTYFDCSYNELTNLNISNNIALTDLICKLNDLTNLDISNNTSLNYLDCSYNPLSNLDVSANIALSHLSCNDNHLITLDVSENIAVTELSCHSNQLTNLNVSANLALTSLGCRSNLLTSLDISNNSALNFLTCYNNNLISLDVSHNPELVGLSCYSNQLTSLNVKNGNNHNFSHLHAYDNPSLTCIQVDDVAWSTANWTVPYDIDSTQSFHESCTIGIEEQNNYTFNIYPNPTTTQLNFKTENTEQTDYSIYDITSRIINTGNFLQNKTIDISGFSEGTYFIQLKTKEEIATQKFIKQ